MSTAGKRILIIDDDQAIRETLCEVLEEEGYAVDSAANGLDAINHLKAGHPPALILLDLMMPVMNGWQFRAEQLRDPTLSRIPVVVISADGAARDKADMVSASTFMKKPIDLEELLTVIERHAA